MSSPRWAALKAAFPYTIPVLTGFSFLGIAYGILMASKGYGFPWPVLMSLLAFCGSMQYAAVTLLASAFHPLAALALSLMVNARHLFYGISMLGRYRGTGKMKPFLIFGLCDETFSILCSAQPPAGVEQRWFFFFVTLLDYLYWSLATLVGCVVGSLVSFDTKGLDFVLTALFVVIFLGQWEQRRSRIPALVGVGCSILCLMVFGPDNFILPAMAAILIVLTLMRRYLEGGEEHSC